MYKIIRGSNDIAVINDKSLVINDVQETIDLIADILYGERIDHILIYGHNFSDAFYNLKTGLLGDITQKFINYNVKVTIIVDYERFRSTSLNAFIKESNRGNHLFFFKTELEGINKLSVL